MQQLCQPQTPIEPASRLKRVSQTSLESVSQTSLDPFVVDLREFDDENGVIRAVHFFVMEEDELRESNEEVTLFVGAVRATADADDGYRVSEQHWFPVVLDSGADATVLPSEMPTEVSTKSTSSS